MAEYLTDYLTGVLTFQMVMYLLSLAHPYLQASFELPGTLVEGISSIGFVYLSTNVGWITLVLDVIGLIGGAIVVVLGAKIVKDLIPF